MSKVEWSSGARSPRAGNSQKTQLGLEGECPQILGQIDVFNLLLL